MRAGRLRRFFGVVIAAMLLLLPVSLRASARASGETLERAISRSVKDVRVLSPEWICVVVDPTAEILAVRNEQFGEELAADKAAYEADRAAGKKNWFYAFSKRYRTLVAQQDYHRPLFASLGSRSFWSINGEPPADTTLWAHSVDAFPGEDAEELPTSDPGLNCRVADMAYLKLPHRLRDGQTLDVKTADGRQGRLSFDDAATPCWSLKVNQSAYSSGAVKKRAYLGMWLPGIGAVDFAAFEGRPFHVRKYRSGGRWDRGTAIGPALLTGEIRLRQAFTQQEVDRDGGSNLTGEDVYELDFSRFSGGAGLYCVQVPGLGRSWPFRVTEDGYGDAFFTVMKGLYHQRCGLALEKPHTAWERPACHLETHQGRFVSETERWYSLGYRKGEPNETQVGFRDESGRRVAVSQFTLIANEDPAAELLPGVRGGWHDAADYDRRIFHHAATWDLMAAAEAFSTHFPDGQLTCPESGNGIPDLLDEAAWSLEVWRRAQTSEGGVCSWIEQKAHPEGVEHGDIKTTFAEDPNPMFAAVPDRGSSMAYAAAAANLARLLAEFSPEKSRVFLDSARRAYAWGKDPANTLRGLQFPLREARERALVGQTLSFDEDRELRPQDRTAIEAAFAAASLYLATEDPAYLADWKQSGMGGRIGSLAHAVNASMTVPILLNDGLPRADVDAVREMVITSADSLIASQSGHAYRTLWLGPEEGWFHAMAWGNLHSKARTVVVAFAVTGDTKYRAAMEAAADFFLGCNPQGTTMVTGIGSVYPVVLQHLHSAVDGITEPVPGIAPYTFTFGISPIAFLLCEHGHPSVKEFFSPTAIVFLPDKLGRKSLQSALDAVDRSRPGWERDAMQPARDVLWASFPIFRRKVVHPMSVVDQNEFTVNETISPLALLFGALTAESYMPSAELEKRIPRTRPEQVPFYGMP